MFELGIPVCSEEFFENIDKSFCENLLGFSLLDRERIETKWIPLICRIKYDDIVFAMFRDIHHHFIDQVSMRIYDRHSLAVVDIIDHLSDQELALSYSCLPDHIGMSETILIIYPDRHSDTAVV
jgi:hypothetical protein